MRDSKCAIPCPAENCHCTFNPLRMFHRMPPREKARYKSILDDVSSGSAALQMLRSAILDVMTLKCPTCSVPVDPFPDACSAVMCLNCGNHYCNYCFKPFVTGVLAHEHVASHSTSDKPENRDAFLPADLVAEGQRLHQVLQLEKCVSLALSSPEYGPNGGHDVSIALVMCYAEIISLNIDIVQLLTNAESIVMTGYTARPLNKKVSSNNMRRISVEVEGMMRIPGAFFVSASRDEFESADDIELDGTQTFDQNQIIVGDDQQLFIPPPSTLHAPIVNFQGQMWDMRRDREVIQNPEMIQRQGATQLANALITYNSEAAAQIMHTYQDGNLDVDYTDMKHGHPLCSLALITGQSDIAMALLKLGANPLKPNTSGRTVLYMAAEAGLENVIRFILLLHPTLDLNAPITSELQRYSLTHVAAR